MDLDEDGAGRGHDPGDRGQLTVQAALSMSSASPPVASAATSSALEHEPLLFRPDVTGDDDSVMGVSRQTMCPDEGDGRQAVDESVLAVRSADLDCCSPAGNGSEVEMSLPLLDCGRGDGPPFHGRDLPPDGRDYAARDERGVFRSPSVQRDTPLATDRRPLLKRKALSPSSSSSRLGSRPASSPSRGRVAPSQRQPMSLLGLPNELLFHILGFLDVCDVLSTSRVSFPIFSYSLKILDPLCVSSLSTP